MEFTPIGALRWVNTKGHGRDKNGTHRRREYAKSWRDPAAQEGMSASAMRRKRPELSVSPSKGWRQAWIPCHSWPRTENMSSLSWPRGDNAHEDIPLGVNIKE